ncbi:NfeD family protein [Clostridium oceanicum]
MMEAEYLKILSKSISNRKMRKEICMEIKDHITDQKEAYLKMGYSKDEAEKAAVKDMGDPKTAGKMLDSVHPPTIDWFHIVMLILCTIGLQILKILFEKFNDMSLMAIAPIDILRILGIFASIYGFIWLGIEKYSDLPFFYGRSQRGGSNANGTFILALGIIMISHSFIQTIILLCILTPLVAIERKFIENKRIKKEEQFLLKSGVASKDFNYKGKAFIGDREKTVYSKNGIIKKGDPLTIVAIKGFDMIVEKDTVSK